MQDNKDSQECVDSKEILVLKEKVVFHKDFPKPGVNFCDIFSLLRDPALTENLFNNSVRAVKNFCKLNNTEVNTIIGFESRGFLVGMALADRMKLSFVPLRKKNKLPGECIKVAYSTEYSSDTLELQTGILNSKSKCLLVDDLIATGGTLIAAEKAIEQIDGAQITGYFCVFEVKCIEGRKNLKHPNNLITLIDI